MSFATQYEAVQASSPKTLCYRCGMRLDGFSSYSIPTITRFDDYQWSRLFCKKCFELLRVNETRLYE
jgi:late competence protein required for DNA uptake (superfamily II DNA/RNA helicase)